MRQLDPAAVRLGHGGGAQLRAATGQSPSQAVHPRMPHDAALAKKVYCPTPRPVLLAIGSGGRPTEALLMPVYSAAQQHGTGAVGGQAGDRGPHQQAAVHVPPARTGLGEALPCIIISGRASTQQIPFSLDGARFRETLSRTTWCWPQDAAADRAVAAAGADTIDDSHLTDEAASSSPSAQSLNDQVSRISHAVAQCAAGLSATFAQVAMVYDLPLTPVQTCSSNEDRGVYSCPHGGYTHCLTNLALP